MFRSITAITFLLLLSFTATPALAEDSSNKGTLFLQETVGAPRPALEFSENPLFKGSKDTHRGAYNLKPNIRLTEKGDLQSFCFSPADNVEHYIGAGITDEETPSTDNAGEDVLSEEAGWNVQLGAGVERKLSNRAALDIDYRYTSSPVEFDIDAFQVPSAHEHHISAGMKLYF